MCGQFGRNLWESAIGQNSNFPLQYQLNQTEHDPDIVICSLPNKEQCTVKRSGHYYYYVYSLLEI